MSVTLPAAADDQASLFVRVLTTNATGSDEWVGVDDVAITSDPIAGNQPPVVACGAPLALAEGEAGTRQVGATDADGTVTDLSLGTIVPDAGGAIAIGLTTAESEVTSSPATATISVAGTLPAGTYAVPVHAENDGDPPGTCTLTVTVTAPTLISAVQGATGDDPANPTGYVSPLESQTVTIVGVVTGVDDENGASTSNPSPGFPDDRGIFVQEEVSDDDGDPRSSEGIFVGQVDDPLAYDAGDRVRVTGTVVEKFGFTQLNVTAARQPTDLGPAPAAEVPAAVTIDEATARAQATLAAEIAGDCEFPSDVCREGRRAYYERLEGMLVELPVGVANAGGVNGFAETFLTPGAERDPVLVADDPAGTTDPGARGLIGATNDAGAGDPANPLEDRSSSTNLRVDHQDRVEGLRGPLTFSFGNYKVVPQVGALPAVVKGPTAYPFHGVADQPADTLRLTFFNVENFFPAGGALDGGLVTQAEYEAKRERIADAIARLLKRPDVVGLEEVGGISDASTGLASLQDLAARLGGYTAYLMRGRDDRFIDVGFLVKDGVTRSNVRQLGLHADESIAGTSCSDAPPRLFDRPPLAIDVAKQGLEATAIVNHWSSKAAPDACRVAQAAFVEDEVAALEAAGREVVVGGDLNAFEFEPPLTELTSGGETTLANQILDVPAGERFSYHFGGRLQVLDHVLVTDGLQPRVADVRFAHFDNEYYDRTLVDGGARCSEPAPPAVCHDGHKVSDHDPPVLTLALPAPPATPTLTGTAPESPANDNAIAVRGTAQAATTVRLYPTAGCTGAPVATGGGAALAQPGIAVAVADDTSTTLRATATDDLGNTSGCSDPLTYVEDSTPPETTLLQGPAPGATIGDPTPTFAFSASEPGSTFACRVDAAPLAPCASPATSAPLAAGAHTFEVRATDLAGNVDPTPAARSFTVSVAVPPPPPPPPLPAPASFTAGRPGTVVVPASRRVVLPRPRVVCPAQPPLCVVTTTARKRSDGGRLGRSIDAVAAGGTARVRVRMTAIGYRELRRRTRLNATVAIRVDHGGRRSSATVPLTLRARSRGR